MNNVNIVISCPHCKEELFIEQINCGIFRHGVFKHNLEQIPPHSIKKICDDLVTKELIFGCGKPFQITKNNENNYQVSKCDYL